jgi:hypothetical protein
MGIENVRARDADTSLEKELDAIERAGAGKKKGRAKHPMDAEPIKTEHRRLMDWYWQEMDRQAVNRFHMAVDHDFYDGDQWFSEDALELMARGQAPIAINEIAPMIDWMIGTQRRSRIDAHVAPRTEDDIPLADVKTKVMKYAGDVNNSQYVQSDAFAEAVKAGLSWLEDDITLDPTREILYHGHESWRFVLWDSLGSKKKDVSDGRYLFRWRWLDLDVGVAMFPDRRAALERAATKQSLHDDEEQEVWYMGERLDDMQQQAQTSGRWSYRSSVDSNGTQRTRLRVMQAWYRKPEPAKLMYADDGNHGQVYDENNPEMRAAVEGGSATLVDRVVMRMYHAILTESDMLRHGPLPHRHQSYPLTPVFAYRRGRDGLPYGPGRRVRDIQEDLNKRFSKAQFLLATNQTISDEGAVEDMEEMREQVDRPDGDIVVKAGKRFEIRRDSEMVKGQIDLMMLDSSKIQRGVNVNDENLGRRTNAESGTAITARQEQGSVSSTEPLDNLRYAMQISGQKRLSLCEQYYTLPKVIRVSGVKEGYEWVKVNEPELQPDGTVRFLNDITASQADYVVAEQDFAGTMRQVMFEHMMALAARAGIAPELAIRLLRIAIEFSDFPNKDAIAQEIRRMSGEAPPPDKMTPEEKTAAEEQMKAQAEAQQMQRELAAATLAAEQGKAAKLNAEAQKIMAEAQALGNPDIEGAANDVRAEASRNLEAMAEQLRQAQAEITTMRAQAAGDTEKARIDAEGKVRVAEIEAKAQGVSDALVARLETLADAVVKLQPKGGSDGASS